ncbi:MAG: hypothetical protein QXG00_01810 [Candidatus Woesearchaeota archaeon]
MKKNKTRGNKEQKQMTSKEVQDKLEKGWILARVLFEIVGNPKEHVINTLKGVIEQIQKEEKIIVLNQDLGEPEEKNDIWSGFIETEMLVYGLDKFIWLAANFTPANIEIIKPEEFIITEKNMTDWLNDILNMMHIINTNYRQKHFENEDIKRNFALLIRNAILLATEREMTELQIGNAIGMQGEYLKPFIEVLIKEKKLFKNGDKYIKIKT